MHWSALVRLGPEMTSFKEKLAEHLPAIQDDYVLPKGLVKHAEVEQHLAHLGSGRLKEGVEQRRTVVSHEECSICLSEFGAQSDCLTTACNHTFHTFCLVEVLGTGACTSCPLCRTAVERLVPGFVDGQMLKLVARLRMGTDAAQWVHKSVFADVQARAASAQKDVETIGSGARSMLPWRRHVSAPPPSPYCCPYPCPYCTLTPSLPSRIESAPLPMRARPSRRRSSACGSWSSCRSSTPPFSRRSRPHPPVLTGHVSSLPPY